MEKYKTIEMEIEDPSLFGLQLAAITSPRIYRTALLSLSLSKSNLPDKANIILIAIIIIFVQGSKKCETRTGLTVCEISLLNLSVRTAMNCVNKGQSIWSMTIGQHTSYI